MKRVFLSVLFAVVGCTTGKNIDREPQQVGGDVGMKHINVDSLTMKNANLGTSMSFTGSQAESLYNSLPKSLIENDPEGTTGFVARGPANSLIVRCARNTFDSRLRQYVPFSKGPHCKITIEKTTPRLEIMQNKWVQPNPE